MRRPNRHPSANILARALVATVVLANVGLFAFPATPPTANAATQNAWRWRNDDGTEANATWAAGENTAVTGLDKNVTKRLRFGVNKDASEEGFARQAASVLPEDERAYHSNVIDTAAGFAYFGVGDSGRIVKVRLSDMTRVAAIDLNPGEGQPFAAAIDVAGGYAYFGTFAAPGVVIKIRLSDFSRVATLTLNGGDNYPVKAVIDPSATYLYLGTQTNPGAIIRIRLSDFTRAGSITLDSGESTVATADIDSTATYGYFGLMTNPGKVVRIKLSDFTRSATLSLDTGEGYVLTSLMDAPNGFLYVATYNTPAIVVKIDLSSFTKSGALTLESGEEYIQAAATMDNSGYGYFGTYNLSPKIIKVQLSTLTRIGVLNLNPDDYRLRGAVSDPVGGFGYFVSLQFPSKVIKIRYSDFSRVSELRFTGYSAAFPYSGTADAAGGYAYMVGPPPSGAIIKYRLADASYVATLPTSLSTTFWTTPVVDSAHGFLYAGTHTRSPGQVLKVRLSDFSVAGTITLESGENDITSLVLDSAGGFLYAGTSVTPGKIIKIRLSDFSRVEAINIPMVGDFDNASIDLSNGYAYFDGGGSPGSVVKVDISPSRTFQHIATLTFNAGENNTNYTILDTANGYGYAVMDMDPGLVVKFDIDPGRTFQRLGALSLSPGEYSTAGFFDQASGSLFITTYNAPTKIIRIRLSDFTRVSDVALATGENYVNFGVSYDSASGYAYMTTYTNPVRFIKVSVKTHFSLQFASKPSVGGCIAASGWQTADANRGAWRVVDAAGLVAGSATTNVASGLTDPSGSFVASSQVEGPSSGVSLPLTLGSNQFTEVEFGLRATSSAVDGATYCFRLANENSTGGFSHSGYAEATLAATAAVATTSNSYTATRLSAGSAMTFGLTFALPTAQSTPLTVVFPSGFTVNSAFSSGACSGGGTIANFAVGANSMTITADKSSCAGTVSLSGASITLPSVAGLYTVYYWNDSPGEVVIPVTDADYVSVTGNIDPTLLFDLDVSVADGESATPYTVDLGGLTSAAPRGSGSPGTIASIWLDLETNATSGALVTIRSANAALRSVSAPGDQIASATELLAANDEGYGLCAASLSGTLRTEVPALTFTAAAPYDVSGSCLAGTYSVGALQTTDQNLLSATGPMDNGRVQLRVAASAANSTPAHPDYQDVLTFVATATY